MKLFLISAIISIGVPLFAIAQSPVKPKAGSVEKQFIEQAALNSSKVMGASDLAKRISVDQKVRDYSKTELLAHQDIYSQLKNLAKSKHIVLPKTFRRKTGADYTSARPYRKADTKAASSQASLPDQNPHSTVTPKIGEGANNSANGTGSGSMISGSTSNTNGGTSEGLNTGEERILDVQDVNDELNALSGLEGMAFEEVYIRMTVSAHENAVALFESAEKSKDPQIRSFASRNLPTLRRHLKTIKDIRIPSKANLK